MLTRVLAQSCVILRELAEQANDERTDQVGKAPKTDQDGTAGGEELRDKSPGDMPPIDFLERQETADPPRGQKNGFADGKDLQRTACRRRDQAGGGEAAQQAEQCEHSERVEDT